MALILLVWRACRNRLHARMDAQEREMGVAEDTEDAMDRNDSHPTAAHRLRKQGSRRKLRGDEHTALHAKTCHFGAGTKERRPRDIDLYM